MLLEVAQLAEHGHFVQRLLGQEISVDTFRGGGWVVHLDHIVRGYDNRNGQVVFLGRGRTGGEAQPRPGARDAVDWLTPRIAGCTCLDLFAGTGVLGIEAASRGAGRVVSVDHDPTVVRALRALATRLGARELSVVRADALALLAGPAMPCDLVFLDPPFSERLWQPCCEGLQNRGWLKPGAWVYLEAPRRTPLPLPAGWQVHRAGRAGQVQFCLALPAAICP